MLRKKLIGPSPFGMIPLPDRFRRKRMGPPSTSLSLHSIDRNMDIIFGAFSLRFRVAKQALIDSTLSRMRLILAVLQNN